MKDQLISFETAKLAKEKGFEFQGYSNAHYFIQTEGLWCNKLPYESETCVLAPTQSLLQKWLREVHNCIIEITMHGDQDIEYFKSKKDFYYEVEINYYGKSFHITQGDECDFITNHISTYEEALEKGLLEGLKLITK